MLSYNDEILALLTLRVDQPLLKGYYGGAFNPGKDKLFAITYVNISEIDYNKYDFYHDKLDGFVTSGTNDEKMKKWVTENSYQNKSKGECVSEGIYRSFSVRFYGCLFEDEWFILIDLFFFGELLDDTAAKKILERHVDRADFWDLSSFRIGPPSGLSAVNGAPARFIDLEEFNTLPYIVGSIKAKRKEAVNRAFSRYINELVFVPFAQKLRIHFPDDFRELIPLYGDGFQLIFSESKEKLLMVVIIPNFQHRI